MKNSAMAKKKEKPRSNPLIDPADIRSWKIDSDRFAAREEFVRRLSSPDYAEDRRKCLEEGSHAKTMFAEWGLLYIEGQKDPANFPTFDPNWGKTKIPSTTVFSVYENRKSRLERDKNVVLILPVTGTKPETMDQVWRCTYTPYSDRKKKAGKKKKTKNQSRN